MAKIDLTANGRLEVSPFVNQRKVEAMSHLIAVSQSGGFTAEKARVQLKETLSTSDAIFSLAHLVNVRNLAEYDKADRQWTKIAAVETVDDFTPQTFHRLVPNFDNLKFGKGNKGKAGVSPRVAELDTYQYAYGYSEEAIKVAIEKRGFKWGVSLEQIINNASQQIRQMPGDMLNVALDTDEFLVFDALQTGALTSSQLAAGTDVATNTSVAINAPFSAAAARVLLSQIAKRQDTLTKRPVGLANQYYVVTALGNGEAVQAQLDAYGNIAQVTSGNIIFGQPNLGNLSKIAGVIESEWITSTTAWYLVPAAGSTRRPSLVKLQLAGRTAPEVLVNNFTGQPIGSSNGSDPFTLAHFDNDSVDLKLRQFTNSALITQQQLGWSTGLSA